MNGRPCRVPLLLLALLCGPVGVAAAAPAWKLTAGDYLYGAYAGLDVNLRWQQNATHAWIGGYRDREFGSQLRAGVDTSVPLGDALQLQPSLQVATLGFIGGSLMLQAGRSWYGLAGIGRTNLRAYFNLNFDPNDAVTVGVGHHVEGGVDWSLFVVADDRLGTQQRDWHWLARVPLGTTRLTVDALYKCGLGDDGYVRGWGLAATVDWPRWFLRVARDPHQNFGALSATRLAAGIRF